MKKELWYEKDIELRTAKFEMEKERDQELKEMLVMFKNVVERIYPTPKENPARIITPEEP